MIKKTFITFIILFVGFSIISCGKKEDETKKTPKKEKKEVRVIENNDADSVSDAVPEEEPRKDILVAIDPGHQSFDVDMSALEANAPGSSEMKAKCTSGTTGNFSKIPEYQLNMDISLLLETELKQRGYQVLLTRKDNETAISNAERATLANDAGADISVRIHANGSEDTSASGALALIPSADNVYVGNLYSESNKLAETVLDSYCSTTGFSNKGIQQNDSMTGINWSNIPVMILEMGFMSNETDDLQMADEAFRTRMVSGIADGLDRYYGFGGQTGSLEELQSQVETAISQNVEAGEGWAVQIDNLTKNASAQIGNQSAQSASLIKLFVAACIYQQAGTSDAVGLDSETTELLHRMISVSDNDATNKLIKKLGGGNAADGFAKVNSFCTENGYLETHLGRLMLDTSASDDNYTSVSDCAKLLRQVNNHELKGAEQIYENMQQQERRGKIPAGVPSGVSVANKTGELGTVQNDIAIITMDGCTYTLCVMSQNLKDSEAAQSKIKEISQIVYQYMQQNGS